MPQAANEVTPLSTERRPGHSLERSEGRRRSTSINRRSTASIEIPLDTRVGRVFFAMGSAVLLPWNGESTRAPMLQASALTWTLALITATPYFLSRLDGTPYKTTFNSYLSVTFTATNFIFLAHATFQSSNTTFVNPPVKGFRCSQTKFLLFSQEHPHLKPYAGP